MDNATFTALITLATSDKPGAEEARGDLSEWGIKTLRDAFGTGDTLSRVICGEILHIRFTPGVAGWEAYRRVSRAGRLTRFTRQLRKAMFAQLTGRQLI